MLQTIRTNYTLTKDKTNRTHFILIKLCFMLMTVFLTAGFFSVTAYAASGISIYDYATKRETVYTDKQVKVILNGASIGKAQTPGILVNGIALLPYNDIFEKSSIDAECIYDKENGTVSISKYNKTIRMTIGSRKATVNGKAVTLPVAPMKVKYVEIDLIRIMVPSRFVAETLGLSYTWNSSNATVAITKKTLLLAYNNGDPFEYTGAQGKVTINNKNVTLGNMPGIITNNTAMLRAKKVFSDSAIGAAYSYDSSNKEITLKKSGTTLVMKIGSKTAYLNGNAMSMDTAPIVVMNYNADSSYVMVPGGFTASCLGYNYKWNNTTKTSIITAQSTASSGGNSGGKNNSPELGDSGEVSEIGTLLGQWTGNETMYGKSTGIHELNSSVQASENQSILTSVTRDYNNSKQNSEIFLFTCSGAFGKIISTANGNTISVKADNMNCADQTYQAFGITSNYINTIGTYSSTIDKSINIELALLSSDFTYDLSLSPDNQTLSVTVYYNTLTSVVLGTNSAGDYITMTGVSPLNVTMNQSTGFLYIDLPYTSNSIGDINMNITTAKYLNLIYSVASIDKLQLILGVKDGYEFYTSKKNNEYTLLFLTPGTGGSSGSPNSSGQPNNSGQPNSSDQPNNSGQPNTPSEIDKSGFEIVIPKPAGLTSTMISDEDNYNSHSFVLRLAGDYTSVINQSNISNSSGTVTDITVSLNSSNETVLLFKTSKLQGYRYVMDDNYIYVHVGNPRDIYKNIVILDPGHGGGANGAFYFGTNEKDLNYKILYTIGKKYFNQNTSLLKVYYTRSTDVDLSLSDRAAFAERYGADLFVSLHMNASLTRSVYGTEIYYSSNNNTPNRAGLTSNKLADIFADSISSNLGTKNRGSRSERYTVIYKNTVPAVLIELGFLSNESDYGRLSDPTFQENTANTIYQTLLKVFEQYPTGR